MGTGASLRPAGLGKGAAGAAASAHTQARASPCAARPESISGCRKRAARPPSPADGREAILDAVSAAKVGGTCCSAQGRFGRAPSRAGRPLCAGRPLGRGDRARGRRGGRRRDAAGGRGRGAGARAGLGAGAEPRARRRAPGRQRPRARARARAPAGPPAAAGDREPAGRHQERGGGLGARRPGPHARPGRRGGAAGGEAVREGGEEGGGGRADGQAHRGAPPADRQPRVLLKGAGAFPADGLHSAGPAAWRGWSQESVFSRLFFCLRFHHGKHGISRPFW